MSDHTPAKKAPEAPQKLGFTIDQSCEASTLGRSAIYQAISDGKLIAKKAGRRTIILPKHLKAYLESLPAA